MPADDLAFLDVCELFRAGNDGRVVLWDMAAKTFVHSYADHDAAVTCVRICGDVVVSSSQVRLARPFAVAHLPL